MSRNLSRKKTPVTEITFSNELSGDPVLYEAQNDGPNWFAIWYGGKPDQTPLTLSRFWPGTGKNAPQRGGVYCFFAPQKPADPGAFVAALKPVLRSLSGAGLYFLWVPDADQVVGRVKIILRVMFTQGPYHLLGGAFGFSIGNLTNFVMSGQCVATPAWNDNLLKFEFRPRLRNANIAFARPGMRGQLQAQGGFAYLVLDGAARGCFRFDVALGTKPAPFDYKAAVEYFYPGANQVSAFRYSLVDAEYNESLVFQASVDPLQPTFQGQGAPRTFLAFPPETRLPTTLRTNMGRPVFLEPASQYLPDEAGHPYRIPTEDSGLLVFLEQDADQVTAAWQGDFHISLEGAPPQPVNLMCGLSGLETIACQPKTADYAGDILRFVPNQPGYAPAFPIPLDAMSFDRETLLRDDRRTTWVMLKKAQGRAGPIPYLSQPHGAPLYHSSDRPVFLDFYPAISADLARAPVVFPLVPYAGIDAAAAPTAAAFEQHIIAPSRKRAIEQVELPYENDLLQTGKLFAEGARIPATTPQGLYVEVNEATGAWTRLVLASSDDPQTDALEFENLSPLLKSAFQTGEQFLVISVNKPSEGTPLGAFHNQSSIEGWPFTLNVAASNSFTNYNNVIVFKFCQGTVADRVKNPKLWTSPEHFNEEAAAGLLTLAGWLSDYVQSGIDAFEQQGDPNYASFSRIVQDPHWNGILALRTDISPKNFPPDLKGLLGGIESSRFKAHHFGINVNRITTQADGSPGVPQTSSLFGLIDYEDQEFARYKDTDTYKRKAPANRDADYAFKVLTLQVLFENSKIKSFHSQIELTINTLFGDRVTSPNHDNRLILTGSYEDHNGSPAYIFSHQGDNTLLVANKVLTRVSVLKASFSTVQKVPVSVEGVQTERIDSRFGLWGYMNFAELAGLDLFSFGGSADDHKGLAYADLGVMMFFTLADAAPPPTFAFDPTRIGFDIATSTPRPGSLYPHFPIKLTGFAYGTRDNLPASQGFLDVRVPDLAGAGRVNGDWYGLVFDLNMGTLGTLTGAAGFNAALLAIWQVGTGRVAVAVKLPGVNPQSKFLNIQGVLKIDIEEIKLMVGETQGGDGRKAYLMTINDIALHFFGIKIPPDAEIDFYLFGDPDAGASPSSLGWYAAYQKK